MITPRDAFILEALALRVRLIAADQVARAGWPDQVNALRNARSRLRQLASQGAVCQFRVLAQPLLELVSPLYQWQPGQESPDYLRIERVLRNRWREPARHTRVFVASPRTLLQFGMRSRPALKNDCQVTHDLHVTQVYLHFCRERPELANRWIGEDELAPSRRHQVLPDAMLIDSSGQPQCAIEFGGRYPAARLERFHMDCAERGLPYELW